MVVPACQNMPKRGSSVKNIEFETGGGWVANYSANSWTLAGWRSASGLAPSEGKKRCPADHWAGRAIPIFFIRN
jgi:hypothetical protein